MLLIGVLVFDLFRDKARSRNEKNKGKDQSTNNVILDRAALIRPYENAFSYSTDA
jgi:hypothetical protein